MIAVFDLDYTLTQRGTWGRFVWLTVRTRPWVWLPLLFETLRDQIEYRAGRQCRGAVKRSMMRWSLQRRKRSELLEMAETFARREVQQGLRPGAIAALEFHRGRGDKILIASAAVDLIAKPIAKRLAADFLVCTRLGWDGERLENEFASENCYGEGKFRAVKAFLASEELSNERMIFYTDSRSDFALLSLMDETIVVDPNKKTRLEAESLDLKIQHWGKSTLGFEAPV